MKELIIVFLVTLFAPSAFGLRISKTLDPSGEGRKHIIEHYKNATIKCKREIDTTKKMILTGRLACGDEFFIEEVKFNQEKANRKSCLSDVALLSSQLDDLLSKHKSVDQSLRDKVKQIVNALDGIKYKRSSATQR